MNTNIRRGLFRVWIILSVVWVVIVCVYSNPLDKMAYALPYFLDHANFVQEQKAARLNQCNEQRIEEYRSLKARRPDWVEASQEAALKEIQEAQKKMERAPLPRDSDERISRFLEQEQRTRDANRITDFLHTKKKANQDAIEARYSAAGYECQASANKDLEMPDFGWLALALLPPTIGVSVLALGMWLLFILGRWIWRGFSQ